VPREWKMGQVNQIMPYFKVRVIYRPVLVIMLNLYTYTSQLWKIE